MTVESNYAIAIAKYTDWLKNLASAFHGMVTGAGFSPFVFQEVAEIALVAARFGQFQQLMKTRVILLILNFTRPHAITYTYSYFKKCCRGERRMSTVERRLHD